MAWLSEVDEVDEVVGMQISFSDAEYGAKGRQTRRDRFLAQIEAATPWALLVSVIEPHYPKSGGRGRPPIGCERMLRMYIAQQCFGLSDEGIEDALYDSQAIRRFVGVDLSREAVPDATTVLKFRRLLETHQLTQAIFQTVNATIGDRPQYLEQLPGRFNCSILRRPPRLPGRHPPPEHSPDLSGKAVTTQRVVSVGCRADLVDQPGIQLGPK